MPRFDTTPTTPTTTKTGERESCAGKSGKERDRIPDKALDLICSKICGGVSVSKVQKSENPRVLVAFGNGGTVSTTGCGYAPAPQARLRHRLQHVYGVRIFL